MIAALTPYLGYNGAWFVTYLGGILLVAQHKGQPGANNAHDDHVVHAHANVLGVVQRRYANVPSLPSQKYSNRLQQNSLVSHLQTKPRPLGSGSGKLGYSA